MKFPYKKILLRQRSLAFPLNASILKPIIPIELIANKQSVRYEALLDSGADFCIFDWEIGELLGLDVKKGIPHSFGGITGVNDEAYFHNSIKIKIGGQEFPLYCSFSRNIARYGYGVLGQAGFFSLFKVKFDYVKEQIEITGPGLS